MQTQKIAHIRRYIAYMYAVNCLKPTERRQSAQKITNERYATASSDAGGVYRGCYCFVALTDSTLKNSLRKIITANAFQSGVVPRCALIVCCPPPPAARCFWARVGISVCAPQKITAPNNALDFIVVFLAPWIYKYLLLSILTIRKF